MRSRAASARRIRSTARSRSSIGGPSFASFGPRNDRMSPSARPRARRIWTTRPGIPSGASPPVVPTDLGMIQRRCGTRLMTIKYPAWVCALVVVLAACAPQTVIPSPSPPAIATASATPTTSPGLTALIPARITTDRHWYALPDGFDQPTVTFSVVFDADPAGGQPFINLLKSAGSRPGGDVAMLQRRTANEWTGSLPLALYSPGVQTARVIERRADPTANGGFSTEIAGSTTFLVSQPEYVVWTLDFEGDASADAELANTAAIAGGLKIPMTVFWNPRVWTTTQVSPERQDAMLAWTNDRMAKGDEVALHLHMWTD